MRSARLAGACRAIGQRSTAAVCLLLSVAVCEACAGGKLAAIPAAHLAPPPSATGPVPALPAQGPPGPVPLQILRTSSASEYLQTGSQRWQQVAGSASYVPAAQPAAFVVTPAKGSVTASFPAERTAWAIYRFDGLLTNRPLRLRTDVAAAGAVDSGPTVVLQYFVGVSDHTRLTWEWHGPYTTDADILLNSVSLRQRLVDGSGSFFACIMVDCRGIPVTTQNPEGRAAVQLTSLTVTGGQALSTKPLYLSPSLARVGSEAAPRRQASALQPSQFPVLSWTHYVETVPYLTSEATTVRIYRQGPDDPAPVPVGELTASNGKYTDPLDNSGGVSSAKGGETYRYFLQAVNLVGSTPLAQANLLTVPELAPQQLQATQNAPGGATQVSWQPCDGAVLYHIWRGSLASGSDGVEIGTALTPATAFADSTAVPGEFCWYFVTAEGRGDGKAANGLEAGALSPLSSPAQGLRAVVLTLSCTTAGVTGSGMAADPLLLAEGQTYQLAATDQAGTDRTTICSYAALPAAAATFGSPAGSLTVQPGAGDFTVTATLSYQGFDWPVTVSCRGI